MIKYSPFRYFKTSYEVICLAVGLPLTPSFKALRNSVDNGEIPF